MVQNLKVDVIYHQTPSDFEMEFNLCGCCRMRLLSDKTTDKKGFIKALARGVARSRVIMICGPLFGAEGLISTVATAIGSGLAVCDNKTYGISGDEQIHIINGSTPLVTPDGYFGGCIIESGPQTIILLTENRAFRKSIMQNLIHPYVEEISYIPVKSAPIEPKAQPQTEVAAITETENYITEPDADYDLVDTVEESVCETVQTDHEHNIEFIMDDEPSQEEVDVPSKLQMPEDMDIGIDMYTEIESESEIKSRYAQEYIPSEEDDMFITAVEQDTEQKTPKKKDPIKAMDISIVILVLILLLSVLALVYFVFLKPYTMGVSTVDYLKEIFGIASSNTLV